MTARGALLSTISVLFGGRIAEEVFMHQMTTGASNDFERATQIARDMVTRYGMTDELGPMVYAENEGEVFLGRSVTKTTNVSEETMQKVDAEIRRIIDEQYAIARKLIEDNQDKMHAMANALLEWETIDSDQIDDIMAGRPPRRPDWTPSANKPIGDAAGQSRRSAGAALSPCLRRQRAGFGDRCARGRAIVARLRLLADGAPRIDLIPARSMGIVNVTPTLSPTAERSPGAAQPTRTASCLVGEGADILDIGGESTRPVQRRSRADELRRVLPVHAARSAAGVPIVSGRHRQARGDAAGLERGADIVNDIQALRVPGPWRSWRPPELRRLPDAHARRSGDDAATAGTTIRVPRCASSASSASVGLRPRRRHCRPRIVLDPGIGFGKRPEHNLAAGAARTELLAWGGRCCGLVAQVDARRAHRPRAGGRSPGRQPRGRWPPCERARASCACTMSRTVTRQGVGATGPRVAASNPRSALQAPIHDAARTYFGTDGIRGTVGQARSRRTSCCASATPSAACSNAASRPTVLIGKRHAHLGLHDRVGAGGRDFVGRRRRAMTGLLPTPGVAYLTRAARLSLGVVISASRTTRSTTTASSSSGARREAARRLGAEVERRSRRSRPPWVARRSSARCASWKTRAAATSSSARAPSSNDLALGPAGRRRGARRGLPGRADGVPRTRRRGHSGRLCKPDGLNINAGVGATAPAALIEARSARPRRLRHRAGRRCRPPAAGRRRGRLYNGDELFYVMADRRSPAGRAVPGAVGTLMTNMAVEVALGRAACPSCAPRSATATSSRNSIARGWQLGGEVRTAGAGQATTGDGIVSVCRSSQAIRRTGQTLAERARRRHAVPADAHQRAPPAEGSDWRRTPRSRATQERVTRSRARQRRPHLIRASGTGRCCA